jgi:hypothetical protein
MTVKTSPARPALKIVAGVSMGLAAMVASRASFLQPIVGSPTIAGSSAPVAPAGSSAPAAPLVPTAPISRQPVPLAPVAPIGPRYDDDASLAAHADPIASYTMRASLDPATHAVRGEGTIRWRNASSVPQRELFVHLYLNAFKNERTTYMRTPASGFRGDPLESFGYNEVKRFTVREMGADVWPPPSERMTPGDPEDETDIRVPLPRDVAPGETITIDMAWEARLPSVALRTGYSESFHMVAQWFPKLARLEPDGRWAHFPFTRFSEFYADFGSYDVTIDVPEAFILGATGVLEKETRAGGRVEARYVQDDIHDFAFTAWDGFKVLEGEADGVALRCLYPPGFERSAEVEIDAARFGLVHFGEAYGRYPYRTLTIVHPPNGAQEAGGMEYPTLITTGGPWLAPWTGAHITEAVTVHELGHQWFYGMVATDEHSWPFLDEGTNSYAEADAMEAIFPNSSAIRSLGLEVSLLALYRVGASLAEHNDEVAQGAADFQTGSDYGSLVYARTAAILHTLSRVYGAERVKQAVGRYSRRYRFEHPGPEHFIAAMAEVLGVGVAATLRVALFERGWVDYAVHEIASAPSEAPRGVFGEPSSPGAAPRADPAPWQGHALVRRRGTLTFPVTVELTAEDGTIQRVRWDARENAARIPYSGQSRLVAAVIDPDHRILLDDNLGDNAKRRDKGLIAPRVLDRAVFAAEAALLLGAP